MMEREETQKFWRRGKPKSARKSTGDPGDGQVPSQAGLEVSGQSLSRCAQADSDDFPVAVSGFGACGAAETPGRCRALLTPELATKLPSWVPGLGASMLRQMTLWLSVRWASM